MKPHIHPPGLNRAVTGAPPPAVAATLTTGRALLCCIPAAHPPHRSCSSAARRRRRWPCAWMPEAGGARASLPPERLAKAH
jgi:hypothetical protein